MVFFFFQNINIASFHYTVVTKYDISVILPLVFFPWLWQGNIILPNL